jgi:hypothetical protein
MSVVRDTWNDLPGWGKMAIIAAGGLGVYKIYSWLTADQSGGDSQNVDVGNNVTYTNNQFRVFADALEAAFFTGPFGMTEDDTAIGVILKKMRTTDDVARLTRVFGVRHLHGSSFLTGGNLVQLVQSLLDKDIKNEVNAYYEANGIEWFWL